MDELAKYDRELSPRYGRRVAVRFLRDDQQALATLISLFGTIQVSPFRDRPEEMLAYGQWARPLEELDFRLRQIGVAGLTLVGLVEEEVRVSAIQPAVQPWRVSVRFQMKNGPLFVYLTNLLASIRVVSVPYSDQLWVEGTFRGPLAVFESSLRELKAEELIVLNSAEASTGARSAQVSQLVTVPEGPKPAIAGPAPASVLERPVTVRMGRFTQWSNVVVGLLIVLVVGSVGWIATHPEPLSKFLNPHRVVIPAVVNPQTVPWFQMVPERYFSSWVNIQRQNAWSNERMAEFLVKLMRLKTDYTQYPSVVARSLALLGSQNVRTPQEFLTFTQSLGFRVTNGWPFPDQPPDAPVLAFAADFNFSLLSFYEALAQQPDVLGWVLAHVGRREG